jgi:type IV fimbrial biogenesis protein FimT
MKHINMKHVNSTKGFTLIELMFAIAVAAIVLSMAVPSFSTMIKNNKVVTESNQLITDINYARSEAITRGVRVIMCRSANPTSATPACGGTSNTWSGGWLIFASGDTNDTYEAATDTLVRIGNPAGAGVTIKTNNTSNQDLEFNPDGTTNESGSTAVFAICDDRGVQHGRQIEVKATGRPSMVMPVPNGCTTPSA